jgi:hypothetical protein
MAEIVLSALTKLAYTATDAGFQSHTVALAELRYAITD